MNPYLKISLFFICLVTAASAQDLPKVQQVSLYAPNNKPEDLFTASADKFQAYNKGNHLYYTIANDAENLYLVVHTADKLTIQKIVRWGLALTVDSANKIGSGSPSVSFPVPDRDKNLSIIRTPEGEQPSKASYNTKMADICKLIAVKNLTGVNGPTVSIYNSQGIKAIALFNDKLEYTYELTVPLKYLNLSAKDRTTFHYNIKLNGEVMLNNIQGPRRKDGRSNPDNDYLDSPTNFSGECTLAAK